MEIGYKIGMNFVPFLFALCAHEYAHGLVAKWRGDNTAQALGRLTLNPLAHADPIGTFVLPLAAIIFNVPIFFGWAKPVPVDARQLKNPRTDMFWIALAGPGSNIPDICSFCSSQRFHLSGKNRAKTLPPSSGFSGIKLKSAKNKLIKIK